MKRTLLLTIVLLFLMTGIVTGCQKKSDNEEVSEQPTEKATTEKATTQKATTEKEDATEEPVSEEKVDIEIMMSPWVSEPLSSETDPYKEWLDETFNANFTLSVSTEFNTEILTRFAADSPPDIVECEYETLLTLYDQGVLVEDWNKYLDKMPTVSDNMGEYAKTYYIRDGKLITLTNPPGGQLWTWNVRKDWLSNLGLDSPKTPEDLLDVARAFTFDDPDGNGENDTYGFTSTGGGGSIGEIGNLRLMFGHMGIYISDSGEVTNFIMDGNEKLFLDFLKTAVDEKIIDPDWYSQGWNDRKPNLYKGMYGLVWYPPMALLNETELAREADHAVIDWYDSLIPLPAATKGAGKQWPTAIKGTIKTASLNAEKDTVKFARILDLFEATNYPNDGYFKIRWGVDIDGIEKTDLDGGYVYINEAGTESTIRGKDGNNKWLYNWGKLIVVQGKDNVLTGTADVPGETEKAVIEMQTKFDNAEFYDAAYQLLAIDLDATTEAARVLNEFEINYVLGNDMDYEAFVQRWLDAGGQTMLDQAQEQFGEMGLIN